MRRTVEKFGRILATGSVVLTILSTSGASGAAGVTKAQARSELLSVADLPTGWTVDNTRDAAGITSSPCLSGLRHAPKAGVKVFEEFDKNGTLPWLEELLLAGPGEGAEWSSLNRRFAACRSITLKGSHSKLRYSNTALPFPKFGNQSAAYQLVLTDMGKQFGLNLVLFRVRTYVGFVLYEAPGVPAATTTEPIVASAVDRLEGKPVPMRTTSS